MYSTWRIAQLKEELKRRGATLRGKKADLVERLEAYDRNFNFENIPQERPELQMKLPERNMFRDVNSNMLLPPITKEHINYYFSRFNKKTDDGLRMYECRYLLVLRACRVGTSLYLKGICKASMKKIQYEVHIKIEDDGSPSECCCECAVGSGWEAHCKHVAVVMFAAEQMFREKQMLLHLVCTQQPQSFHIPKKTFTASPLRAETLPSKRQMQNVLFHPYPLENINKENYNVWVRNICIGATSSTMPMKQLYRPANPYGVINDHIYGSDPRDILCNNLLLSKITKTEISDIEVNTRGQTKNHYWHEQRENRITASHFHTVCHLTLQKNEKFAEQLLNPTPFQSRATIHGLINEPVAIQEYKQKL
ncbi:uncharacterized protein [Leptinotarsa decemlineata]|uniref:uncharacterized protein n=1 Tax=Leptinotarsa decemlineata TaxID=7539 RepID=UPI003D307BB4